jgi:protein-S-isoprenylcysteine O-methyltransferase Ste14
MLATALVVLQLGLFAALLLPWSSERFEMSAIVPLVLAASLGVWALTANRPGNFSVFPTPRKGARLVTGGPYRHVRHPMYLAVLLAALGLALGWHTTVHAMSFAALALVLHVKAGLEERLLLARFPEYRDYRQRTPRILPFPRRPS